MQTKVFGVEGMSCGHCQQAVEAAALAVTGVQKATVQLEDKTLTVTYDETYDEQMLRYSRDYNNLPDVNV